MPVPADGLFNRAWCIRLAPLHSRVLAVSTGSRHDGVQRETLNSMKVITIVSQHMTGAKRDINKQGNNQHPKETRSRISDFQVAKHKTGEKSGDMECEIIAWLRQSRTTSR